MTITAIQQGRKFGEAPLADHRWLASEKLDGWRARWTGRQMALPGSCERIVAWPHPMPDFAMDGELWIARGRLHEIPKIRRNRPCFEGVTFMAFDVPEMAAPFSDRYRWLAEQWMAAPVLHWQVVVQTPVESGHVRRDCLAACAAGAEGLMLHRADSRYVAGRTNRLLKVKPHYFKGDA